jgi:hypothetical protein
LEERRAALRASNLHNLAEQPRALAPLAAAAAPRRALPKALWQGRLWPALQTVALLLSLAVNVALLVLAGLLVLLAGRLFEVRNAMLLPLVDGLHDGFVQMDEAHIRTTITVDDMILVDDTLPVEFDLPLQTSTVVTLTEAVLITGATVNISGGVLTLNNAPTTILLPAGTPLPVELNLSVPVRQTVPVRLRVPVRLQVPVDIPLDQTDLHAPFTSLRDLIAPYQALVNDLPDSWDVALCRQSQAFCGRDP